MNENLHFSIDKNKLDVAFIHQYLSTKTYWAKGRSIETVKTSIENSMCIGAYEESKQVGFARVVTDYSVFAWIMDVFIIEEFRNQGLGKKLMEFIFSQPKLKNIQRWGLTTTDAHELYKKYGFRALTNPDFHMEIVNSPS